MQSVIAQVLNKDIVKKCSAQSMCCELVSAIKHQILAQYLLNKVL